jgi:CxxC-x17-CxxC domain-containing protein
MNRDREMFEAVCADCGEDCKVPFKPQSDAPIYCSRCFEKHDPRGSKPSRSRRDGENRGRRDSRRDDRRNDRGDYRRDRPSFRTICDGCGNNCEVPFKPTGEKPVYCDNCYSKDGSGTSTPSISQQIEDLNNKVDMLIEALKPIMPEITKDEEGNETLEFRKRKTVRAEVSKDKVKLK